MTEYPVPFRPGIPIPPEELRFRVTGDRDAAGFHYGGKMTLDMFRAALRTVDRDLTDFADIYDFGCGCGRLTPWLQHFAPHARLHGSDIDDNAIDWLRHNFPEGDFRQNQGMPPLPFRNLTFDLIIGYSVFTHLDTTYQDAWLAELNRMTRPGAVLLLTANLDRSWQNSMEKSPPEFAEHMRGLRAQIDSNGLLFYREDGWEEHFPDFYHTTWHAPWYVREHWSRWFEVRNIVEGASAHLHQATVVLQRREESPRMGIPSITADAHPDQTHPTISWHTGDGSGGQVWMRHNDTEERLFAEGPFGSQIADFIDPASRYTFTLYKGKYASSPAAQGVPVAAQMIQTKTERK